MQVYQDQSANVWVYHECVVPIDDSTRSVQVKTIVKLLSIVPVPPCAESTRSVQVKTIVELLSIVASARMCHYASLP